jgi:Bacterial Ig-like domain
MRANSQLSARRVLAGLMLAVALALVAIPVARASAALSIEPYAFTVATLGPTVTLDQPPLRSNDATPSFHGTASGTTPVTVEVYAGTSAAGKPVATLKVEGTGGSWVSANVSPPVASGTYTATASQESSIGNATGVSDPVTFEVDTRAPTVTLAPPPSRSNDTTPSFSGTASEASPVTVEIFEGARPEGDIVATASASGTRGGWSSGDATPALPRGRHIFTALAIQPSEIKNAPGKSAPATFEVDTEPPTVTLRPPASPSNDTAPSFSGTASEASQVTVKIFAGPKAEGQVLATATATASGGSWISGHASPALGSGTFTALAMQQSAIGNPAGKSPPVTFIVDTAPPTVTLNAPPSRSPNRVPAFSGTASDHTPVTVEIHEGGTATGPIVATAAAETLGGEWVSGKASPALPWGEYTAVASQPSSIGNPSGASSPVRFAVQPIAPTVVTEGAAAVTRTSAALYASVDPRGGGVSSCYFEYGTASYGTDVECGFVSGMSAFPPAETAVVPVFARIYGLSPGVTYHFRIVAVGEGGTGEGVAATFTTLPPRSDETASRGRQVSPRGTAAGGVVALIARQLAPRGRAARLTALIRSGAFKQLFKAPGPGRAAIAWYYASPAAKRASSAVRAPVLVAFGGLRFRAAGTAAVMIHLSAAGRRLVRASRHLRLTATCVFTPLGEPSVRASATFELSR